MNVFEWILIFIVWSFGLWIINNSLREQGKLGKTINTTNKKK